MESNGVPKSVSKTKHFQFKTPSECRDYEPPEGNLLIGDNHLVKGNLTVIGGPPGVGKSRAATALAVAGATGKNWMGLNVHKKFKTVIIQNENGPLRLRDEFRDINEPDLDKYIRICDPPPNGLNIWDISFRNAILHFLQEFQPDCVILDPWNSMARKDNQEMYLCTINNIRSMLPKGMHAPAVVIIAHTRKSQKERKFGIDQREEIAGSHVLTSVPRTVFIIQSLSSNPSSDEVVVECVKNNDGEYGEPTGWHRRNGLFLPIEDFDYDKLHQSSSKRKSATVDDLRFIFNPEGTKLTKKDAVCALKEHTGLSQSACYEALNHKGKFKDYLKMGEDKCLSWSELDILSMDLGNTAT